ncbi:MAG: Crp/Fnr family transcriptional regulator [Scytonema sp. PMC 1069.18]|nr:Crp/Fnr family transcriptional regulator [Scytonema sp. PMC 1069.18]MEC4883306.1 Crp/Fnr family transcriptional regulator [Scytonema sp. PMC 1070.18]
MAAQNCLLDALPHKLYEKLIPYLRRVTLERGQRLHEPNEPIIDLYFPLDCVLSITITMNDGRTAETGIIGKREVIGVNAFMGDRETTQTTYIVQVAGSAMKIDAKVLLNEFDCNKQMRDVMLRYTQAFIAQLSQTTACNSLHNVEQRLARWLLEVRDRVEQNNLTLTQEFIAEMLGVRRSSVTQTAQKLQENSLIRYHRGNVEILDLQGLENYSCECFKTVKQEYDRLLGEKHKSCP